MYSLIGGRAFYPIAQTRYTITACLRPTTNLLIYYIRNPETFLHFYDNYNILLLPLNSPKIPSKNGVNVKLCHEVAHGGPGVVKHIEGQLPGIENHLWQRSRTFSTITSHLFK